MPIILSCGCRSRTTKHRAHVGADFYCVRHAVTVTIAEVLEPRPKLHPDQGSLPL